VHRRIIASTTSAIAWRLTNEPSAGSARSSRPTCCQRQIRGFAGQTLGSENGKKKTRITPPGRSTRGQELFRHFRRQIGRSPVSADQPITQIREQVHMVDDRVQGIPLTGQFTAQATSQRRQRPTHHDRSSAPRAITRVHDCLLPVDGTHQPDRQPGPLSHQGTNAAQETSNINNRTDPPPHFGITACSS
jgi:hypothetical protein